LEHEKELYSKALGCILRENPELTLPHEAVIICGALVEDDHENIAHVIRLFHLHTTESRKQFLKRYATLLLEATVIPLLRYGFAFEAHGQNMLLRVKKGVDETTLNHTHLIGFAVRDFGGVMLHVPTWNEAIEQQPQLHHVKSLPQRLRKDAFHLAPSISACYRIVYHTVISCHLHRLVRTLELHEDGSGWELIRSILTDLIPRKVPLWTSWMETKEVDAKAFLRMKSDGLYRDYVYEKIPNVLYRPVWS
jgi:siderophore synthetase component